MASKRVHDTHGSAQLTAALLRTAARDGGRGPVLVVTKWGPVEVKRSAARTVDEIDVLALRDFAKLARSEERKAKRAKKGGRS